MLFPEERTDPLDYEAELAKLSTKPWFTISLFLASTAMLVICFAGNGWAIEPYKNNPMIGT